MVEPGWLKRRSARGGPRLARDAESMIGLTRLDNLASVWSGCSPTACRATSSRPASGAAARHLHARRPGGVRRPRPPVWVADSFAGSARARRGEVPGRRRRPVPHLHRALAVSRRGGAGELRRYGLLDDQVVFLEGWFTRHAAGGAPIAALAVAATRRRHVLVDDGRARAALPEALSAAASSSSTTTARCPHVPRRSTTSATPVASPRRSTRSTGRAPTGARAAPRERAAPGRRRRRPVGVGAGRHPG